jgi:prepilin-type N-terminal cleavage/methylation domain-containing protein
MAKRKLLSRLQRFWFSSRCDKAKGFTLLELLVVTAIAGGIVAGLMYIVVELMGADQRESSKSETQREMQLALDYISTEMRDAVYVYTGDRMDAQLERNNQSLISFLPAALTNNSVPVIAFWKQQPFPDAVKTACAGAAPPNVTPPIACTNGSSYALVVYSLSQGNPSNTWKGKARITRYALTEFKSDGTTDRTPGYLDPGASNNNFETWPYSATDTGFINLQVGRPSNAPAVLVDFVDNSVTLPNNAGQVGVCPDDTTTTNVDYNISPSTTLLGSAGMTGIRSFYACVNARQQGLGQAQDVLLYVRGNVFGRPGGFGATSFLPTLETRVLSRGVLGRVPN